MFVAETPDAGRVVELLWKHDSRGADQLIQGLSPATMFAPAGVPYANRRSELVDKYLRKVHARELLLPDDAELVEETAAFAMEERDTGIWYPSATDVAKAIDRYPAKFMAIVHATIPAPPPGQVRRTRKRHDPYEALA